MKLSEMWKRLTTTLYARELEQEVARLRSDNALLRAENRGLLNSILGIAGVPPVPASAEDLAAVDPASAKKRAQVILPAASGAATRVDPAQKRRARVGSAARVAASAGASPRVAVPMRKRSWQQINRMLEFESGRKEKPIVDAMASGRG